MYKCKRVKWTCNAEPVRFAASSVTTVSTIGIPLRMEGMTRLNLHHTCNVGLPRSRGWSAHSLPIRDACDPHGQPRRATG